MIEVDHFPRVQGTETLKVPENIQPPFLANDVKAGEGSQVLKDTETGQERYA
jgi:hypothetical protein